MVWSLSFLLHYFKWLKKDSKLMFFSYVWNHFQTFVLFFFSMCMYMHRHWKNELDCCCVLRSVRKVLTLIIYTHILNHRTKYPHIHTLRTFHSSNTIKINKHDKPTLFFSKIKVCYCVHSSNQPTQSINEFSFLSTGFYWVSSSFSLPLAIILHTCTEPEM